MKKTIATVCFATVLLIGGVAVAGVSTHKVNHQSLQRDTDRCCDPPPYCPPICSAPAAHPEKH